MADWNSIARRVRVPLGFVFALVYLWLAHPAAWSLIAGSLLVVIGLVIRALASGHVRKNEQLTTTGPYAYTRNPLYLGSLLLATGFIVASRSWIVAVIAATFFIAIYVPVIHGEEDFLRGRFPEFDDYSHHVPRLLPRLTAYKKSADGFEPHLYWKHREYNAAIGAACMMAALIAETVFCHR